MLRPETVIQIALAEVGYLEKKNGDERYLYDKTANAGDKNYTKYGYEMHKIYPEVMDYPAYWCDCFVDWCFYKAYGISNAKRLLAGDFDDWTIRSSNLYKGKNAWHKTPEVGDQVFFWNPSTKKIHHTGLVTAVKETRFECVEGNTSNGLAVVPNGGAVCLKSYSIANENVAGFGRPGWDKQPDFTPHWEHVDGKWYWREAEGQNAHGWYAINHHWYWFDDTGAMATEWKEINDKWYYFEAEGALEGALYRSDCNGAQEIWYVE